MYRKLIVISRKLKDQLKFKNIKFTNFNHLRVLNDKAQNFFDITEEEKLRFDGHNKLGNKKLSKYLSIILSFLTSIFTNFYFKFIYLFLIRCAYLFFKKYPNY